MKKCKKILHLLSFFALMLCTQSIAADFSSVDLQRLIKNHPLMQSYQPETGRFKNTPSEIQSQEKVSSHISSISARIESLEKNRQQKLTNHLENDQESEETIWSEIRIMDSEIQNLTKEIKELEDLAAAGGIPGFETVLRISEGIWKDVVSELNHLPGIVINNLPVNPPKVPPALKNNDLRRFFYSPDPDSLMAYTGCSIETGFLFRSTSKTIVFQKRK